MATDIYGQGISVASLTDAPNAGALASGLAAMVPRTVMRFASASARSAALVGDAAPVEGMITTLADTNRVYRYSGTAWEALTPDIQIGTFTISGTGADQYTATVNFPRAFASTPVVCVNIASATGGTSRWTARADSASTTQFTVLVQSGEDNVTATWSSVPMWYIAAAA